MNTRYTDEQVRFAAKLYYMDGVNQSEVARLVQVSQAKVSRLLSVARERGIVRISVDEYEPRNGDLEKGLRDAFGLGVAIVVETAPNAPGDVVRATVGHIGAQYVAPLIPDSGVLAIAGGRTVRELAGRLPERDGRRLTIVQAMGSIDSSVGTEDAIELGRSLVQRWGGFFMTLSTPAFVPNKRTRDSFLAFRQIQAVWERFTRANAALVGIGAMEASAFVARGVLTAQDIDELKKRGATGEICGRFFDRNGNECDTPWRERVISIGLDELRRIPQVVAVVPGAGRAHAVAAAIRGRLIKTLVIDEDGARALLAIKPARGAGKSASGKTKR
jgi:DNA-binding transcriptional regulator LsrR (DeoR family)